MFCSKVIYKANCWDFDECYIDKTKWRLHDRKTLLTLLLKGIFLQPLLNMSEPLDIVSNGTILIFWAREKSDLQCKIKETLFIQELKPSFFLQRI